MNFTSEQLQQIVDAMDIGDLGATTALIQNKMEKFGMNPIQILEAQLHIMKMERDHGKDGLLAAKKLIDDMKNNL